MSEKRPCHFGGFGASSSGGHPIRPVHSALRVSSGTLGGSAYISRSEQPSLCTSPTPISAPTI